MYVGILWVVHISLRCGSDNSRHAFKEMQYRCWSFFPRLLKCIVIHPDSCCIVKLLHTVIENHIWRYTFVRDMWKEIMKNNLISCYKYLHWDPFMDVNLKYHWQGICLPLSVSLLFKVAWKIQCSIIGFWCHPWWSSINDVTLNASITLDMIEHCKYLTLAKNYFYCASSIDLWTDHQLIHVSVPCNCNMLQSWARRLTVRTNGMAVSFNLMSVSCCGNH